MELFQKVPSNGPFSIGYQISTKNAIKEVKNDETPVFLVISLLFPYIAYLTGCFLKTTSVPPLPLAEILFSEPPDCLHKKTKRAVSPSSLDFCGHHLVVYYLLLYVWWFFTYSLRCICISWSVLYILLLHVHLVGVTIRIIDIHINWKGLC